MVARHEWFVKIGYIKQDTDHHPSKIRKILSNKTLTTIQHGHAYTGLTITKIGSRSIIYTNTNNLPIAKVAQFLDINVYNENWVLE